MANKDEHQPPASKPTLKTADKLPEPLRTQCFTHKGELVIAFNQPVIQWFLPADSVREFARVFKEAADMLDAQEAGQSTKQ